MTAVTYDYPEPLPVRGVAVSYWIAKVERT